MIISVSEEKFKEMKNRIDNHIDSLEREEIDGAEIFEEVLEVLHENDISIFSVKEKFITREV